MLSPQTARDTVHDEVLLTGKLSTDNIVNNAAPNLANRKYIAA